MFKILFLILVVMSWAVFAQNEVKPQAALFDEFETATNGYVKMKMDSFFVELSNNPSSQGCILNYGTNREIAKREKQLRNSITFRKFDAARIVFVNSGFRGIIKTELWIVPAGAENPAVEPAANKIDEFGNIANGDLKARLDNFFVELQNRPNKQGSIFIVGPLRKVSRFERLIKNYITLRKFDSSRIKFINGGISKDVKTELWIDL